MVVRPVILSGLKAVLEAYVAPNYRETASVAHQKTNREPRGL